MSNGYINSTKEFDIKLIKMLEQKFFRISVLLFHDAFKMISL